MNTPVRFLLVDAKKLLYRGGQPNKKHIQMLHKLGIKNVINLRKEALIKRYLEYQTCKTLNINYYQFPHFGLFGMSLETINEIVDTMHNLDGPVYVHCKYGRDRTGLIIASYLVKYNGIDPSLAWSENVLNYGHDENVILYSQFKTSFFNFCDEHKK